MQKLCVNIMHHVRCNEFTDYRIHINMMCIDTEWNGSPCQWGSQALLMSPAAIRKKLFLCCEDLVKKDHSEKVSVWGGRGQL